MAIEFTCPLCGKQTVVADQYAGQTGPCANCGGQITIPLASSLPGKGFAGPTSAPKSGGGGVLMVVLGILAVCLLVCCGGGVMLFFFGRSQVRLTQDRIMSQNNLRQLGVALHNYHDTHKSFPPAVVTDADGKPLYSGRVLLLPFLEQAAVYERFDKSKAWDSAENQALSQVVIPTFQDPANKTGSPERSDYVFVTGKGTAFDGNKSVRLTDMTDGTSNTIVAICTSGGPANWAAPQEWNVESGVVPAASQPDNIQVLFADGSVQVMKPQHFQQNIRSLASHSGGDVVPSQP
jgi:hypothetical protein